MDDESLSPEIPAQEVLAPEPLRLDDAVNETCPWSGKPIAADSLTLYRGFVVGFCNPGCRDKFETATRHFEAALAGYQPEDDEDAGTDAPAREAR